MIYLSVDEGATDLAFGVSDLNNISCAASRRSLPTEIFDDGS